MDTTPKPQPRPSMDFYYDYLALMTLLGLLITGLVLWPLLGFGPAAPKYYWSLHRQQWISLHLAFALAFSVICMVHIVLHWRWVKLMTPRHLSLSLGLRGVAMLLVSTLLTTAAVWGGYVLLEKNRLTPEAQRRGVNIGKAWDQDGGRPEAVQGNNAIDPGTGQSALKGRGPRWRGGRGGF